VTVVKQRSTSVGVFACELRAGLSADAWRHVCTQYSRHSNHSHTDVVLIKIFRTARLTYNHGENTHSHVMDGTSNRKIHSSHLCVQHYNSV